MLDELKDIKNKFNLSLTDKQASELEKYVDLIKETNAKFNLVSKSALENLYEEHIADSLSFGLLDLDDYNLTPEFSLIDIGSGGGFPAIPIAILYPESVVACLDSVGKKMNFLKEVSEKLSRKLDIQNDRIENLARDKKYRELFDIVTARALSGLNVLLEYSIPFLKVGGILVAYKTQADADEIDKLQNVCKILGCEVDKIHYYDLDGKDLKRCLIVFRKTKPTNDKYPRSVGSPAKNPLI